MNNQNYIRKAVKLANGWNWLHGPVMPANTHDEIIVKTEIVCKFVRDALAAQLVRQYLLVVNAPGNATFETDGDAMNTIKAIVDSGVLKS